MRVMAGQAIRLVKGLILVRLLQLCALGIVAVEAECRGGLRQMEIKLGLPHFAGLVGGVASVATHVEGRVPAALCRNIQAGLVAAQAEVLFLVAGDWLQQLILIIRGVGVVALEAVPNRWTVHRTFDICRFLVGVAGQAQTIRGRGDQLHPSYIFIGSDFMTTGATHRDRRMDRLTFRLVLVAGNAGGRISFRIKGHGMLNRVGRPGEHDRKGKQSKQPESRCDFEVRVGAVQSHSDNTLSAIVHEFGLNRQPGKILCTHRTNMKTDSLSGSGEFLAKAQLLRKSSK